MHTRRKAKELVATIRLAVIAVFLVLLAVKGAFAQATMTLPDYSTPLLTPASQAATAWTNVIPNALADYYTYTPYTAAAAVAAGFPPGICGVTEDCYTISARKFQQQLALPSIFGGGAGLMNPATGLPFGAATWVYGYGTASNAPAVGPLTGGVWHFPAPTLRGTEGRPIRIQWLNELPNEMPAGFDPTVNCDGNAPYCYPYNRIVTHVHGAHVTDDSDGYARAWFTPGFVLTGPGWAPSQWGPEGTYRYPMTQEASTIWYHDHAMGVTHNNTQMGLAGFFPITDANEQSLIANNILPTGAYELGFALQDRMFDINGQMVMPDYPVYDQTIPGPGGVPCTLTVDGLPDPLTCTRLDWMKAADGHLIPYVAGDPLLALPINAGAPFPAASTTLEYFGNMPVVNGVTYGTYTVEARRYRMRFIGGTDSRTWIMKLVDRTTGSVIPFWQIGSEQGLLNNPVMRNDIDLMPGERVDVLVDFTGIAAGTKVVMQNLGPDAPYAGPGSGQPASIDIPEIMEFVVTAVTGTDTIVAPSAGTVLRTPILPLVATAGLPQRNVALEEIVDQYGRTMPTIDQRGFFEPGVIITEVVHLNDTEVWNIINTTVDAHPMHLHLVAFQTVGRQAINTFVSAVTDTVNQVFTQAQYTGIGPIVPPTAWEAGWKDTVDCPPGQVTTVIAKFDIAGSKYVWHCHILSHEEHDMMRPLAVVGSAVLNFSAGTGCSITGVNPQTVVAGAGVSASPVTAVPTVGYHFVNWTGNNAFVPTTANPMTVANVTQDMTITANCAIDTFTVNFLAGPNGSITGNASQTVNYGASTTPVTAVPAAGYHFVNWTGTGGFVSTSNPLTVTNVTANDIITANFAIDTFTVTGTSGGGGTITPASQVVNYNTTAALTVTPDLGYHIVSVTSTCGGTLVGNTFTTGPVTANCAVTATFAINTFTVTGTSTGNGTITPASQVVNYNTTAALTVTPDLGYHIVSVTSTCGGTLVGNTFTTGPVTADCAVTASFAIDTFAVNFIAGTGGSITGTLNQTVPYGGSATAVTAVPTAGYHFVNWTGTGGFVTATANPLTVTNVTAAMDITANFAIDTFTVTGTSGGNGTITPASQVVNYNTTAALTVTPDLGYHIASVTSTCGGTLVGNTFTTGPVTADCTVTANFAIDTFTVTGTSTGNGTITPASQAVNYNTTAALTVTPALHYHIASVTSTCGGTLVGNTFTTGPVTANCAVTANFAIDTFAVNFIAGTGGSITGTLNQTVPYGGSATAVTAVPAAGYHFVNWTGTGGFVTTTANPLTVTNVTAAMTITANFAINVPVLSVTPTSLAFGDQLINTTSAPQTATVCNTGSAPLIITGISIGNASQALITALNWGGGGSWFDQFAQTNNCPKYGAGLAPGACCTASVTFRPTTVGAKLASLDVNVAGPAVSQSVALSGTGVSPVTQVSPTSLDFGNVKVGKTSPAQTVTLTNTGTATLFLKNISIVGWDRSQFAQTGTCPIDAAGIAPGASCTINVTFKPTHKGSNSATLFIDANVPALDKYVSLSGTGK